MNDRWFPHAKAMLSVAVVLGMLTWAALLCNTRMWLCRGQDCVPPPVDLMGADAAVLGLAVAFLVSVALACGFLAKGAMSDLRRRSGRAGR